ncbi:MAG: hypothetical protein ABIZ80_07695 [Bryobacteraceae bacterium]
MTKKQSDASRINGAKSTGPKSAATLAKSSQNSLRHGFAARKLMVLSVESQEEFNELRANYIAGYQPAAPVEEDLVAEMIAARWRIRRLWLIEDGLFEDELQNGKQDSSLKPTASGAIRLARVFNKLATETQSLALLTRYEAKLDRMHQRAHRTLLELQERRLSAAPAPVEEPQAPLQAREENCCQTNPASPSLEPVKIAPAVTPVIAQVVEINRPTPVPAATEPASPAEQQKTG